MKKRYIVIIVALLILIFGIVIICCNSNKEQKIAEEQVRQEQVKQEELKKLKELFEEYSVVKVYIKKDTSAEDVEELCEKIKEMKYFNGVYLYTSEDAYQELLKRFEGKSEVSNYLDKSNLQDSIWANCIYLDDISLLDEDGYFEKIKADINRVDEKGIIANIVTAGIINIYNEGGMDAVNEYVYKVK